MKNALPSFKCLIPLILLCCAAHLYGVNHVVQLGQSIQDKVALADTGDVVIIRGGTYPGQDINGSKAIRLVREKDTTVTIGGNITFSGVDGAMVLRDFTVDLNGNGKLTLSNCSQFGLEDLTKVPQGITLSGSTVIIRDCNFTGNLTIEGNSSVEMINSSCANLDVNGSKFHSVGSVFAAVTATDDANITLVDSNFTTGTFTSGLVFLKNSTSTGNVTFNRCDWRSHGSTFKNNLTSNNSHTKLLRSEVYAKLSHNDTEFEGEDLDCIVFQSKISKSSTVRDCFVTKASRTWVSYSKLKTIVIDAGHEVYIVGNKISPYWGRSNPSTRWQAIYINDANCRFYCANNFISTHTDFDSRANSLSTSYLSGIHGLSAKKYTILNNVFYNIRGYSFHDNSTTYGRYPISIFGNPEEGGEIRGNAFYIDAPFSWSNVLYAVKADEGIICTNNYFQQEKIGGNLAHFDNFTGADPGFTNVGALDFSLTSDSILKDAGSAEFRFNDHDGTRNDVGMFGGHAYDINGTNADIPVVLSTTQSVYRINTGDTAPLIIQARGAVATP